jgi:hypothetical protein
MAYQKCSILVLKSNRFVMRLLVGHVPDNCCEGQFGHRECCVTVLPRKLGQIRFRIARFEPTFSFATTVATLAMRPREQTT